MTSGTQNYLSSVTFPCSTSLGLWRDSKEIQVLVQAEAAAPMAVNLGSCSSSEFCHQHGMNCLSCPVCGCQGQPAAQNCAAPSQPFSWLLWPPAPRLSQGNKSRRGTALMEQAQPLSCRAGKSGTSKGSFAFLQMP